MELGIGKRIKAKRLELGLTQLELAQKMGYTSRAAICKVEKGQDNITSDRVTKFANALGCSESYIMGWEDESGNNTVEEQLVKIYADNIKAKEFTDLFLNAPADVQEKVVNYLKAAQQILDLPHLH